MTIEEVVEVIIKRVEEMKCEESFGKLRIKKWGGLRSYRRRSKKN
jgi:hypothetical protein